MKSPVFATSLLFLAGALATYATLRVTFGPRPVYIHVRWAPAVDDAARLELEQRYALARREFREGRTWGYTLPDLSRDNIASMVRDAAVEDTHYIHRTAFRPWRFAPRRPYLTPYPWVPVTLEFVTVLLLVMAGTGLGLALLERSAPSLIRGPTLVLRDAFADPRSASRGVVFGSVSWLRGRIPAGSPESVALFRIVFGMLLLWVVLREPVAGTWAAEPDNVVSSAQRALLGVFVDAPWTGDWIRPWTLFWGVLFIAGAYARAAYAMLLVGVFGWVLLYTTRTTYHTVTALQVTLLCLLWSRWGDAWSIDAWRRPDRARGTPEEYGCTTWTPGFVLGIVFAAAAFAKLRASGVAWILNGTVKYHFLSDSRQAMVDWGLQLVQYHGVAVLLSLGAIAIESLVIVGVLSRRYRYRLLAGVAAMALLSGFALFQGLIWRGWWILLLSFLPWHLVRPTPAHGVEDNRQFASGRRLQPSPVAVLAGLVLIQTVVSLARLEISPLISTYDMYSTTYASPAEYELKAGESYWLVGSDSTGRTYECRVTRADADVVNGEASASDQRYAAEVLRRCFDPADQVRTVFVEARRPHVNWAQWRQEEPIRVRLAGPLPTP